jgi:hypothetical protein
VIARLAILAVVALSACTPWRADPSKSTEVELADDLSPGQVDGVHAAIEEINTAVGREVFHVKGDHAGYQGHVTVTTLAPHKGEAQTFLRQHFARIRLGQTSYRWVIAHELLHTLLGGDSQHSTDKDDLFYPLTSRHSTLTEATIARIEARMEDR